MHAAASDHAARLTPGELGVVENVVICVISTFRSDLGFDSCPSRRIFGTFQEET